MASFVSVFVINADICMFIQGEVFVRYIVDTAEPTVGSSVGHAVVKGMMPRGGLVKLLIRVLDGAKWS